MQIGGSNYYYTRDHLGSIRELTGTDGLVQGRYDYDPYGQQTQVSGTISADFGFTGLYVHQPCGLLLAPYRAYSASLGRWLSRDPLASLLRSADPRSSAEILQGPNLYEYVRNNVIKNVDPMGLGGFPGGMPNYPEPPSSGPPMKFGNTVSGPQQAKCKCEQSGGKWQTVADHDYGGSVSDCMSANSGPWWLGAGLTVAGYFMAPGPGAALGLSPAAAAYSYCTLSSCYH